MTCCVDRMAWETVEVSPTISYNNANHPRPRSQVSERIDMPHPLSAALPPPPISAIDILAPNLETLIFQTKSRLARGPLIPSLPDAPIPMECIGKLKTVGFACNLHDNIARLEAWLSPLDGLNKLFVRNVTLAQSYGDTDDREWQTESADEDAVDDEPRLKGSRDTRACIQLIKLLVNRPELFPKVTYLELDYCYTDGRSIVEAVRKRKTLDGCANIESIVLKFITPLSMKALAVLEAEVPMVKYQASRPGCKSRRHRNGNFEFAIPPEWAIEDPWECGCFSPV